MAFNSTAKYIELVDSLISTVPGDIIGSLREYINSISRSELQNRFVAPMFWIGMYIALASLVCILAMVADLLHGFRSKKLWFPCKYFRVNAAFLTVISVAMKLPVDLTGTMVGQVDRTAKVGSMAFMCTMMANLLPCLATMGSDDLLSNIIALCVLVITLAVNVCIQIQTGVLSTKIIDYNPGWFSPIWFVTEPMINLVASIYVIFLVFLLIVHLCSSVAILKSKKIIESKYHTASKEIQPSLGELLTPEKLHKHVRNHWIMAGSGSPQFIAACFPTTSASGVISLLVTVMHTYNMYKVMYDVLDKDYDSDYGGSMMVILIVQFIGVVIGTIAPVCRCFSTISFKVSPKIILNHFKVYKVERYWTQKLYDWKHAGIGLPFRSRNLEVVIETLKRLILNLCIGFQNGVVVICKVVALIPFLFMICVLYCFRGVKCLLKAVFSSLGLKEFEKLEENNDLHPYVLKLEDDTELGERTLASLAKSVNRLIQKGAKSQPNNLKKLILGKSTSCFQGVKNFDQIDHPVDQHVDCWSLPVITLTTIAISLPTIEKEEVNSLLESVKEGLEYITVVQKSLNADDNHVSFQKAAANLWQEIRFDKKWLGNQLQNPDFQQNAARQIVEWFRDKVKNIVYSKDKSKDNGGGENDDRVSKFVCANSMYRITETILLTCHTNIDATDSQKELFDSLSSMIADITAACLTNLPHAITMKCHASVIEEREESVKDAAQLLGETTDVIKTLQGRDIPGMNPSDLPFINKWREYLRNP